MRTVENTLALWVSSLMTSDEVIVWAGKAIAKLDQPPMELFDLVSDGPEQCLKRAQADFPPRPSHLSFVEEFSVRVFALPLDSENDVAEFVDWASRRCMGEDLTDPMVLLGYRLDHLLNDCDDRSAATALVRESVPALLPLCNPIAEPFLEREA